MPLVSVLIPTYNHQDFVLATINSVLAQTFTDFEVIVVNDGSPDRTAELLRPLAESQQILYVEQTNGGQARARNRGLALASGKYIAFLDDDDLWPPNKLEWQVDQLEADSSLGVVGGTACFFGRENETRPLPACSLGYVSFESVFEHCPFLSPGQALIRKDLLLQIGGLDPEIWGADDWDLWFRLAKVSRIRAVNKPALIYRQHLANASRNKLKMLRNAKRVLSNNLALVNPADRRRLRKSGRVHLLRTFGRPLVNELKACVRQKDIKNSFSAAFAIWRGFGTSLFLPPYPREWVRHWIPVRLRR